MATLTLNFTSASLDPIITLTRSGATATRVNASGFIESVAADTARFDYDPTTLQCKGLLIEEQRQNVSSNSADFIAWSKGAASVSANAGTSPDGANNAFSLIAGAGSSNKGIYQSASYGTGYTFSLFAKKGTANYLGISFNSGGDGYAVFNLNAGTVETFTECTARVEQYGNGWYRCVLENTTISSSYSILTVHDTVPSGNPWAYNTTDGVNIYIWGFQLESGSFVTSYIPTTSAAVTRNADVATITGTNFSGFWNAGVGGTTVTALPSTVSGTRPLVQFDDGTANEIIALRGNTTNPELYIVDGGTPQAQIDAGTIAANTSYTLTGWWQTNFCAARLSNGARVEDLTATIPTVTQMRIGSDGTNYLNGTIATIYYYDRFTSQIYNRRKNKVIFSVL